MRIPVSTQEPIATYGVSKPYDERTTRLEFNGSTADWFPDENVPIRVLSVFWDTASSAVAGARSLCFTLVKARLPQSSGQPISSYHGQSTQHGASQVKYATWLVGADAQTWLNTINVIYETHALGAVVMLPGDHLGFVIVQGNAADVSSINIVYEVL